MKLDNTSKENQSKLKMKTKSPRKCCKMERDKERK